jgi:3-hydroxyisobutyrate dehydrogenase-like beta-hydroxyacid dehydrogenase
VPALRAGSAYLDLNSVAPVTRRACARAVGAAGAHYIEGAVMAPIAPQGIGSPILLGGPSALSWHAALVAIGFSRARVYDEEIGRASAAKLCRSVVIKGLESLLIESLIAARHHGVESDVLDSLSNLLPGADWLRLSRYLIARSRAHGLRRADEMHEAARTVADAGIDPWMSLACVQRQRWAAAHEADLAWAEPT